MSGQQAGQRPGDGGQPSALERTKEAAGAAQEQALAAGDTAKQAAGQAADRATAVADAGMDRAAGGMAGLAGTIREKGQAAGDDRVRSAATAAADTLEAGAAALRATDVEQLVADLEALVRRRPIESLLVAAGVGFLLARAAR